MFFRWQSSFAHNARKSHFSARRLLVSDGSFTMSATCNNNCTSINMQINKCNARCSGYLMIALKWSRETEVEVSFHQLRRLDSLFIISRSKCFVMCVSSSSLDNFHINLLATPTNRDDVVRFSVLWVQEMLNMMMVNAIKNVELCNGKLSGAVIFSLRLCNKLSHRLRHSRNALKRKQWMRVRWRKYVYSPS